METMSAVPTGDTVLIEFLDTRGRVMHQQRFRIGQERRRISIGRSVTADVTIDDEHAAALHAAIEVADDGQVSVSDLGSVNGVVIAGQRHHKAERLPLPQREVQIGRTLLRIRTSLETLAPEKADHRSPISLTHDAAWIAGIAAAISVVQLAYSSWLGAPRDLAASIVTLLATTGAIVALWVAVWALLSRVMQGEWRWLRHFAIILGALAMVTIVDSVAGLAAFMFSISPSSLGGGWIGLLALGAVLCLHLMNASSLGTRRAVIVSAALFAVVGGVGYWLVERTQQRNVNHIESTVRLYPPDVRLVAATPLEDYFKRIDSLRDTATAKMKALPEDDDGSDLDFLAGE